MNLTKILAILLMSMICLIISCIIIVKIVDHYLVLHHHIQLELPKKTNEEFSIVNGVDMIVENDAKLKVIDKCENKSLNEMHHRNIGEIENRKNMCESKELKSKDAKTYAQTLKIPQTYTADTPKQGVMGANYMMFNDNPNPYHLDYPLFSKDEDKNIPVGTNYVNM
jgi:hypothetical protein